MANEPKWLKAARAKLGTKEAAGSAISSTILGWAKRLGTKVLGVIYNTDSVPWCGVFGYMEIDDGHEVTMAYCFRLETPKFWRCICRDVIEPITAA